MMGLYTFLKKKMLVSNILWVCLVALFVGLSIEAKGQGYQLTLISRDGNVNRSICYNCVIDIEGSIGCNEFRITDGTTDLTINVSGGSLSFSNGYVTGNDQYNEGGEANNRLLLYYKDNNWYLENLNKGSFYWNWSDESYSSYVSGKLSSAQDPNGGSGGGGGGTSAPTITNVPTPSAQCAANQINISTPSVDYHGSSANGSCWQYNNNNQWNDIISSTRLSVGTYQVRYIARNSNGQTTTSDQRTLTINDKPTINTSTISTPSAGSTLASVSILVSENGSTVTNRVWKRDGNTVDANSLTFQAGQTYNLTYEVTNGCGTSSQNYSVTIPSNGGQAPTINTTSLSITPGMNLSEVHIDVDLHGCTEVNHHWKVDGIDIDQYDNYVFQANHTYSIYYEITSSCGTSSKTFNILTGSGGGSAGAPHHVISKSGDQNGQKRSLTSVNSSCYSSDQTDVLFTGDWRLEDEQNNKIALTAEFEFGVWGSSSLLYGNSYANGREGDYIYPALQNCGWNHPSHDPSNYCSSYSGTTYTLYIYKRDGVWYASEDESKCQAAGGSTLSITPNTAQKVACDDITFLASESSNSLEWYYGTTLLSNGDGITINGNRLTISPSYVYTNDNADVYAKNGDVESNKVAVSKSEIVLRTNSNENVTLTRYTNSRCPGMCAYMFNFNQINNFWTQWWFEKDGEKLSIAVAPDCHSDIKLESNGNFKEIERSKFTSGYVYYDNGWKFSNEDPCRCLTLSVNNTASVCGDPIITLDNICPDITNWVWQRSDDRNNWTSVQNNGTTLSVTNINNTIYFRVVSGNEISNVVSVVDDGVVIGQSGNPYNTYSLTPLSGCSVCAFTIPLNGSVYLVNNDDWYLRTVSGSILDVVIDSDASFVTKKGNETFYGINSGDSNARFYSNIYLYEDGGVWHLTTKNPCHCITVDIAGDISCENMTLQMTKACSHDDVREYKWYRWDGSNWIDMGRNQASVSVSSNDLNGSKYVKAAYSYGDNNTWIYSEPIEVPYLPFELTSVYNVPSLVNVTSGAELEVSQIKPLCCNNYEITVRKTGNHGDWDGWAYLHAEGYEFFYAGENNTNLDFKFVNNSGANIHYWEVLAVNSSLANHKFYIYIDKANKRIFVSSYNDERVIGFDVENADNFPCDNLNLSLVTEPCSTVKYQWYANVDGNIRDIPGATGKTLTVTKEMYETYEYTNVYGIKVGGNDWDQYNTNYRQRDVNFGWMIPTPSITGSNGVSISKIVTLCCDANGGKLHRVDYSGTGHIQFNGYTHVRINNDETGFETTTDGVDVNNATGTLYVYVTGDKAFWSTNRPESYVVLNITENVCNICSGEAKSVNVSVNYSYNNSNDGDFKNAFGLQNPTFIWEGSNNGYDWTVIAGATGSTLSGEVIDTYKQFRVSLPMGCETLSTKTTIDCGPTYPSVTISGTLRKCQTGTLSSTIKNLSNITCSYTLELQESEDENIWTTVKSTDYSVSGNIITIDNVSSTYYRYVMNVNGNMFYSNSIKSRDVVGVDLKVSYNKSLVYGLGRVENVEFVVMPSDVVGYWEKLENGVWVSADGLPNISGAKTTKLDYKITDNNHKAIFRFFATEKCTRSEAVELKINEIDPVCASEGSIIISFNGMNAGQFAAHKSDTDPYMFIHPKDSKCYDNFPQNMHNSHAYQTGDGRVTYLGIEDCSRIGKPTFPTAMENVFEQNNAYYITNRNAMVQNGGPDAVIPPSYFDNDMYYLWWHGGATYQSHQDVTLPKIYPMMGIQYPSEIASGATGKISVRFWLITDGLEGENPCHFGFFSDRHGSKTVASDGTLISTLEENPFYNQNCTLTCEATGQTWNMAVNNSMMVNGNNNDCLTEVKVADAQPGWYTMTAEFVMDGMLTGNDCPVFYPMVLPYSDKVGVAVEYLLTDMHEVNGHEVQNLPVKPSICISAESACTSDAVSLFVKDLDNLGASVQNVTIRWYDEADPNRVLKTQNIGDIAGNGVARFDTLFPEGVSYVTYRCEVELTGNNGQKFNYKNYVQVGRDSKCYDCVYIGEDIENVVYTKETEIKVLTSNVDLPFGVQYVWQWSDKRYNSESKWIDIPSDRYTLVDGGLGIKINLKKEDFENHPYIRVVVKENNDETHCSSNAIHLSPMETKCSWEIKGVEMINPQEYEVKFADKYRIVFHVENNENWIDDAPSFTMKDIQDETVKNIVCVDKDIDGNWYYDVQAVSDYEFTITQFCTDFSVKDPNYKSIIVRAIRECQSATGSVTRVWYDDFGRFYNPSNTPYPTITPNGEGGYNFSSTTSINPDMGFDSYIREIEIDGIITPSPVYTTDEHAFAKDQTGALTNEVVYVTEMNEGCWGGGIDVVKHHVNDGSYAIVYNAAMGSCVDWGVMTEDHTPNEEHGGMLFINMPPSGGTVYSGNFKTKCREAVAIVSCYVANANQKDGKIPCNVTFNVKDASGTVLATYHSGDIFSRYQSDPAYQENPWTHLTFRVPLAASYQAEYYNYTFEIVSKAVNTTEGNDFLFDDVEIFVCEPDVTISSEDKVTHEQEIDLCDPNPLSARVYAVPEVSFCNFFPDMEDLKVKWQMWTGGESQIGEWVDVFTSEGENGRALKSTTSASGQCQDKYSYFYPLGQVGDYRLRVIVAEENVLQSVMADLDQYKNVLEPGDNWPDVTCNLLYAHSSDFWVHVHESREQIDTVLYACPGETVTLVERLPDGYQCEWQDINGNVLKSESSSIGDGDRDVSFEFVKNSTVDKVVFIASPGHYNTDPDKRVCPRSTNFTVNIPQTVKIECSAQSVNLACQADFEKSEGATILLSPPQIPFCVPDAQTSLSVVSVRNGAVEYKDKVTKTANGDWYISGIKTKGEYVFTWEASAWKGVEGTPTYKNYGSVQSTCTATFDYHSLPNVTVSHDTAICPKFDNEVNVNVTPAGDYSFVYEVENVTYATPSPDSPNVALFNPQNCTGPAPFKVIVTDNATGCSVLKDTTLDVDGNIFVTYNNAKNPFTVIGDSCEFSVPNFINPSEAEKTKYGVDSLYQYLTATSGCGLGITYTQTPEPGTKFTDSETVTITASNECGGKSSISFVLNTNMPTSQPELEFVDGACPNDNRIVRITGWTTSTDSLDVFRKPMDEESPMIRVTPATTIVGDELTFELDFEYDYLVRMTHVPAGCSTDFDYKGKIRPGYDIELLKDSLFECDPSITIKAMGIVKDNTIAYDNVSWQYTTDTTDERQNPLVKW
ncbi:MAG: hypothetical protein IKV67_11455, partial [Paludibacteraceae bacterium]|nr:hypothetical protein [Paludibacteraceae bacterium]